MSLHCMIRATLIYTAAVSNTEQRTQRTHTHTQKHTHTHTHTNEQHTHTDHSTQHPPHTHTHTHTNPHTNTHTHTQHGSPPYHHTELWQAGASHSNTLTAQNWAKRRERKEKKMDSLFLWAF